MFYVYALFSPSSGKIYIGQTEDLDKRIIEHDGATHLKQWTHRYNPWEIFYHEECASRSKAMHSSPCSKTLFVGCGLDKLLKSIPALSPKAQ